MVIWKQKNYTRRVLNYVIKDKTFANKHSKINMEINECAKKIIRKYDTSFWMTQMWHNITLFRPTSIFCGTDNIMQNISHTQPKCEEYSA